MSVKKYFWSLNPKALKSVGAVLRDPRHPKFVERAFTLLSRCDDPKEVFLAMGQRQFAAAWPGIRRYWAKTNQAADFRAWWESVYEQLIRRGETKKAPQGEPSRVFLKIGGVIKHKRSQKRISQFDFARLAKMSQPDISAIEAGKKNVTLETLVRLCKILDIKNLPFS